MASDIQTKTDVEARSDSVKSTESNEKQVKVEEFAEVDLDRVGEVDGYVLDEEQLKLQLGLSPNTHLKKSKDGRVLIPQPTDSSRDPLNWPEWKKNLILFSLTLTAATSDYSAATGASALLPQAQEWEIDPNTVNHAVAGNTFMIAVGGITAVWLSAYMGRLPVAFWFQCFSAATAAWSAAAKSFESYMAARILNGFFAVSLAAGGLMWIKDLWFYHEHPRKINIWSTALILSPFLGPQFMAAIISVDNWRTGMWLDFGIITFALIVTVVVVDETFYPRHLPMDQIPASKSRVMRLIGIEQIRSNWTTNSLVEAGERLAKTLIRLPVFFTCLFYFIDFPWTIANNTTISVLIIPAYNFTFRDLAAIYSAPVIGAVLGLVCGHFLFDFIGSLYSKRHGGKIIPEARLVLIWLVLPLKIVGYVLIGVTLQHHWSFWVLAVGWLLHNFSTIVTTTAVSAYLIDAYPEASGECAAWLNFARTVGGFIVGYFQIEWAASSGPQLEYGIESALMAAAFLLVVFLQFFGPKIRASQGPLHFKTS